MYVVVGLGNPGRRYAGTRHNVGFMVIERLAERWHVPLTSSPGVRIGRGEYAHRAVVLAQPQRYMNRSGEALVEALPMLKQARERVSDQRSTVVPSDELIVAHDDLDLPCGQLRVKRGGGSGGHRGVDSIAAHCGAEFFRVRIGVGRPGLGEDPAAYVLATPPAEERETIATAVEHAAAAVALLIDEGLEATMNRFNQRAATTARSN